jgi:YVTN family beta-propeller protein
MKAALGVMLVVLTQACTLFTVPVPEPPVDLELSDSISIGDRPFGVAVTPGGTALVTQLDGSSVTRFTLSPPASNGLVVVGSVPTGIAVNPAGTHALVTNQADFTIGVIDVATGQQIKTIDGTSNTFRAAFNSTGTHAFVTQAHAAMLKIDMATQAIVDSVSTIQLANGVAIVGDTLAILASTAGLIAYIDIRTMTETKRIPATGFVSYQDVVVSGSEFFVASESHPRIEVRALITGAPIDTIEVSGGVFGMTRRPNSAQLWATHPGGFFEPGSISVIDVTTRQVLDTIRVNVPRRIAFNGNGTIGVVASESGWVYFLR